MLTSRKIFLRQAGLALAGSCLPFHKILAKEFAGVCSPTSGDTYHPVDCSIDLATEYKYSYNETTTSQIAVMDGFYSYPDAASSNMKNPYSNDVLYKAEGQAPDDPDGCNPEPIGNECNPYDFGYNNSPTYVGQNPFRYKVYYPKDSVHDYVSKPLPVYILFHAGGFQECPSYSLPIIKNLCIELSRKGFICFTVEYRRGRIVDTDTSKVSVQQQFARYRAIQDGCGAIRSIMKKNSLAATHSDKFPFIIDTTQVFVGGTSAGGIIAMGCAYYQTSADLISSQTMMDNTFPMASASAYNIKQTLGKMHSNRYYALPDDQYWPKIAGVANLWGGIVIPKTYDSH